MAAVVDPDEPRAAGVPIESRGRSVELLRLNQHLRRLHVEHRDGRGECFEAVAKRQRLVRAFEPKRGVFVQKRIDDKVDTSWFEPCLDVFPPPTQIFANALTLNRPAAAGGASGDLVFRGSFMMDQRLYHSKSADARAWDAPFTQSDLLTTRNPSLVRLGDGLHVVYAGGEDKIFDATIADSGGGGSATRTGSTDAHKTARAPVALVDGAGALHVVFTAVDSNLMWFRRAADGTHDLLRFRLAGYAIELLEPAGRDGSVARFLARRGEGFHHLAIDVEPGSIDGWCERLRAAGKQFVGHRLQVGVVDQHRVGIVAGPQRREVAGRDERRDRAA